MHLSNYCTLSIAREAGKPEPSTINPGDSPDFPRVPWYKYQLGFRRPAFDRLITNGVYTPER